MLTGGQLVKINRFAPSSQLCSSCGNKQKMPLSIRTYNCPICGLSINRDYNAALNIKEIGLKLISNTPGIGEINACGDTSNGVAGIPVTNYVSKGEISFLPTKQEQVLEQFAPEATSFRSW